MTKKKEGGAGPREYEAAFKAEARRLWQSRGQAAEKTAQELGIGCIQPLQVEAQRPPLRRSNLQLEVERLQRERTRMTEQRDILKKSRGASPPNPRRAACPNSSDERRVSDSNDSARSSPFRAAAITRVVAGPGFGAPAARAQAADEARARAPVNPGRLTAVPRPPRAQVPAQPGPILPKPAPSARQLHFPPEG
jgi:hypothetical protein